MALLEILVFPDPKLREKAKPVKAVSPELTQLADDLLETMYAAPGIGLAATQVGRPVRLIVIDTRPRDVDGRYDLGEMTELEQAVSFPVVLFNPQFSQKKGKTTYQEGCLSVPTYFETVERADYVEVSGLDRTGKPVQIKTDGLLAICLQHEVDHLDGKLFIDRLSFLKSTRIKNKIKKHGYEKDDEDEKEEVVL